MQSSNFGHHLDPLNAAAGATRLVIASDGSWIVAELAGRWLEEEFTQAELAPPVLKLIERNPTGANALPTAVATANGWAIGRPDASGALYLDTDAAELTYRLSWLVPPGAPARESVPLEVPPGIWAVKSSFSLTGNRGVVALWRPSSETPWRDIGARREEIWLAVVDTQTGNLVAQSTWTGLTPRVGAHTVHVGMAGGADALYLIDQAGGGSRVIALDGQTLATRWSSEPSPLTPPTGDGATLAASGNGAHILVILGNSRSSGVAGEASFLLDADTGKATAVESENVDAASRINAMAPGEGDTIVFSTILDTRGAAPNKMSLHAVLALDAQDARVTKLLDTGGPDRQELRDTAPVALVSQPGTSRYWVAPPFRSQGLKTRREREEVDGLVDTPRGWYQPGRPRIDEWLASQR